MQACYKWVWGGLQKTLLSESVYVCMVTLLVFLKRIYVWLNRRRSHSAHLSTPISISFILTVNMGAKEGQEVLQTAWLTSVASLVHHQHIGANANYPTDIALELPVGQPDTAGRGEGLGFGARLWAVHLGPRGIDHAQVFRALLLLHTVHVTGQPILLITASLNFNVTGWKRGQGGATV